MLHRSVCPHLTYVKLALECRRLANDASFTMEKTPTYELERYRWKMVGLADEAQDFDTIRRQPSTSMAMYVG